MPNHTITVTVTNVEGAWLGINRADSAITSADAVRVAVDYSFTDATRVSVAELLVIGCDAWGVPVFAVRGFTGGDQARGHGGFAEWTISGVRAFTVARVGVVPYRVALVDGRTWCIDQSTLAQVAPAEYGTKLLSPPAMNVIMAGETGGPAAQAMWVESLL